MVISWILNSLGKEIADSIEYVNDAVELWNELEDRYDQTNGAKLYKIHKEINDLSQGISDITDYYTKMKKLWEELNSLNTKMQCSCACTCGAKESVHKEEQDMRLIQFLMGLNEVYTTVRGTILMMNSLPSLTQAFHYLFRMRDNERSILAISWELVPHLLMLVLPLLGDTMAIVVMSTSLTMLHSKVAMEMALESITHRGVNLHTITYIKLYVSFVRSQDIQRTILQNSWLSFQHSELPDPELQISKK